MWQHIVCICCISCREVGRLAIASRPTKNSNDTIGNRTRDLQACNEVKLSVYHSRVFIKLNKMVFTSQTHLLFLYLLYYSGNMFRLAVESSSGPYIQIQTLNLL
jgi:hypothetical protein